MHVHALGHGVGGGTAVQEYSRRVPAVVPASTGAHGGSGVGVSVLVREFGGATCLLMFVDVPHLCHDGRNAVHDERRECSEN